MKTRAIPISEIEVPEVRVTAVYAEETQALLRSSLEAMGTVQPIVVTVHDGKYTVVDGLHRLEEARARGEKTIDAVIYQGGLEDNLLMNLVLNNLRGKTRPSEMVAVIGALTDRHGLDSDAIATRTGLTRSYIEQLWAISRASPEVIEALEAGVIGVGHAYQLSRLPLPAQQEEAIAKMAIWRMSVKQLKETVDQTLVYMTEANAQAAGAPPREPPAPPVYRCQACQEEQPPDVLRSVILCPRCYGAAWRKAKGEESVDQAPSEEG